MFFINIECEFIEVKYGMLYLLYYYFDKKVVVYIMLI